MVDNGYSAGQISSFQRSCASGLAEPSGMILSNRSSGLPLTFDHRSATGAPPGYRGTTVIGHRVPGARLRRASAVTREQSSCSASAT